MQLGDPQVVDSGGEGGEGGSGGGAGGSGGGLQGKALGGTSHMNCASAVQSCDCQPYTASAVIVAYIALVDCSAGDVVPRYSSYATSLRACGVDRGS
jgi:hypothetical protein